MKYFVLMAFLFVALAAQAQTRGHLAGRIISRNEKAAEGATVQLLRAADSVIVSQTVAGEGGAYRFESLSEGRYLIAVTATGHRKSFSKTIEIHSVQTVQVPPIPLIPVDNPLAEVTVTATRPLIEQKTDRIIVNVDALVTNTGKSALEVLENAPGVAVDKDGNIRLKGKEGVLILIDGRPVQLSGEDLSNLLRSMNSGQMDQVEIMTNPPAKYDASGTAGVINIKTKKKVSAGYNGSATTGFMQGRYPKTNESVNFNYRKNKFNLFANLAHSYRSGFGTLSIQRNIFNSTTGDVVNYLDQDAHRLNDGNAFNGQAGLDYFASKKTTVGLAFNSAAAGMDGSNKSSTNILSAANELQRVSRATVDNSAQWKQFGSNLNFRTLLNTKGRELTADLDFIHYHSDNRQFMVNAYYDAGGNTAAKADSLKAFLPQNIKLYSGRMDYVHPLKKGSRFGAGIKTSLVRTDNDARYDSIKNGRIVHDFNRSNHFIYEENINAAYANLTTTLSKKISMQLGLRLENTNAKGVQKTTGEQFDRNYTQLFPTAYFQYKADEKNTILLNYGRRVRRPNYPSLNPFIRFIDRYTYSKGNPALRPELSDNIELSHNWRNRVITTVNYTHTADIFDDVIEQKGEEAYQTPANIASHRQFGLAVNANTPVAKWWTCNIVLNVFNNRYKGRLAQSPQALEATSFILNGIQQFKINPTLTAEISGRYRNGWLEGVIRARPVGFIGAGFSQQLFGRKAILRLSVRDIFFTQRFRGTSRYGNVDFNLQQTSDSRVIAIGFTYRFSKGKKITPSRRTEGSAGEEQQRIGEE
jgi:iron complex outermembrane receptor protein